MVATKRQLVPAARKLVSAGKNLKRKICIHDTGNTSRGADAQAHANLQSNGNSRAASWHWTVDDKEAIQSYRHNDRCWHSGTSKGNGEAIAVEVCVNSDGDYGKAIANAAELVAKLLKDEKLTLNDITTHNGYSGADCPRQLRNERDGISWDDFVRMVREAFNGNTPKLPSGGSSSSSGSSTSSKTVAQLAQEVLDGKHGNGDARKLSLGSQYNAVQAEVNRRLGAGGSSTPSRPVPSRPAQKSTRQLAQEVIDGKHGNGDARRRSLGSRYNEVQAEVNRMLGSGGSSTASRPANNRLSIDQVARQIVNGQGNWGNDPERSRKLRAAGYDPAVIQRRVNQLLK